MFDQAQIQEFKEVGTDWYRVLCLTCPESTTQAFNMIDQNRDGFIDSEDLKDMLASLGRLV